MKFRMLIVSGLLAASCVMNICAEEPGPEVPAAAEALDSDPGTAEGGELFTDKTEEPKEEERSSWELADVVGLLENALKENGVPDKENNADEDEAAVTETEEAETAEETEETEETDEVSAAEAEAGRILNDEAFESRFRAGKYRVGEDMPEGEYVLFSYSEENATVRVGVREEDSYSVSVDAFTYDYMKVFEEGNDVTLVDCFAVPVNSVKPEMLDLAGPGMYKTGMHFAPGVYSLVSDEGDGSYTIFSTISPEKVYREGEVGKTAVSIQLSAGQYIVLKKCRFEKTPDPAAATYTDKNTILRVQAQLNMIEYDCGKPDGVLGSKTAAAIRKFQEDNDLVTNGKITPEFLKVLEEKSPYSGVEAELGPFIIDTDKFISRYNEAALALADAEDDIYASLTVRDIAKDKVSPNKNGSYVFGTNHAADRISSAFYILKGPYDRQSVIELSLLIYGLDTSCSDLDTAKGTALKLLFDGQAAEGNLEYKIVPMEGSNVAWICLPE